MKSRFLRAAFTSAALSLLFVVVYGACNQLTALRSDVGTIAFAWERHIPFVPLLIVPYMSIDLFFVVAPFLCATDDERRLLSRRITLAVLIAGACFLLFPLKFAFDRPTTDGLLGAVFDRFREMDLPYNLAPSLHIALRTLLAAFYARHTRGVLRVAMHIWFSLIGLSTLLVWQHHILDVVAGFILGWSCLFVFPENPAPHRVIPNQRVAFYYAAAAALSVALATILRPWGAILLWPAFAFGLLTAANLHLGASIFQKQAGRLPFSTRALLAPVLFGQWLSLRHYSRHCRAWDEVAPYVWIGRVLSDAEAREAIARGVTAVLDLTGEFSEAGPFRTLRYRNLPILDLTAPSAEQLGEMSTFIARQAERGIVYVHCKIGYSRSAAAVGAFLIEHHGMSVDEALARLREARPSIIVRPEIVHALHTYAERIRPSPIADSAPLNSSTGS